MARQVAAAIIGQGELDSWARDRASALDAEAGGLGAGTLSGSPREWMDRLLEAVRA